jgi:hypothetical protein
VTFDYEITNAVLGGDNRVSIGFRIIENNGVDPAFAVTFDPYGAVTISPLATQGFTVSSPTSGPVFYIPYATSFMGISPADFDAGNATSVGTPTINNQPPSVSLVNVWNGTQGELLGPDPTGAYTAILGGGTAPNTGAIVPAGSTMLRAVLLGSFVQTNAEAATGLDFDGDGATTSSLSILAKAAYKDVPGFTPRRQIVSDAKCSACHEQLGFDPDFHGGARNNGEICNMCHNPIRNSSSWSGNQKDFVHSIHAGFLGTAQGIRTNKFGWHASEAYWTITYPSNLSNCEACHLPGTYDFSAPQYTQDLINRMLPSTASSSNVDAPTYAGYLAPPPWLVLGDYRDVGTDKSANLVVSPIASPCLGCHDSQPAVAHMRLNGAQIYVSRGSYVAGTEACLVCHGPGRSAAIQDVHYR